MITAPGQVRNALPPKAIAYPLVGAPIWGSHMGQSAYLRDLFGRNRPASPSTDHEKGGAVRSRPHPRGHRNGGARPLMAGFALGLAEMAIKGGIGSQPVNDIDPIPTFFGDQAAIW